RVGHGAGVRDRRRAGTTAVRRDLPRPGEPEPPGTVGFPRDPDPRPCPDVLVSEAPRREDDRRRRVEQVRAPEPEVHPERPAEIAGSAGDALARDAWSAVGDDVVPAVDPARPSGRRVTVAHWWMPWLR